MIIVHDYVLCFFIVFKNGKIIKMSKRLRKLPIIGRLYTMVANMYHMDKMLLEHTDKTLSDLRYVLDVQRILDKNLFPTYGFERLQAELIANLSDRSDEFAMFDKLPIEHITGYANGKTVAAAHYSKLISEYAAANNLTGIEAVGIEPAMLPGICQGKDTLIIANPVLSALVLLSPNLLREIAQKLRRNLTLVVRAAPNPARFVWEGFYDIERENGVRVARWAEGSKDNWRIHLINLKTTQVTAQLKWLAESFCDIGELTANCRGETVKDELNGCKWFKLNVTLYSGDNELAFSFTGPSRSPGTMDTRNLAFKIIDFSCCVDGINVTEADFIHEDNKLLLADDFILRTLHNSGFYDVTSTAYANHGIGKCELKKTRYMFPYYRIVSPSKENTIERDDIVCYNAYRLTQTEVYEK